jgi:hypothetical protein
MPCCQQRRQCFFIFKMRSSFAASLKRQINLNYFHFPNRDLPLIYVEESLHGRFKSEVLLSDSPCLCLKSIDICSLLYNRKVAGWIPVGVTGIFHWRNFLGLTLKMGPTQPLTEMSTGNISWGVKAACARVDKLTTFMYRLSWNLGKSNSWNFQCLSRPVQGSIFIGTTATKIW